MLSQTQLSFLVKRLSQGATLAYPTEAVYGLGCHPAHDATIAKLLQIKNRPWQKGVLLVGSRLADFTPYIAPLSEDQQSKITQHFESLLNGQETPVSWIVPAGSATSPLLRGMHRSIGIRLCAHPLVGQLCDHLAAPLVSTSANISGRSPARNHFVLQRQFGHSVDLLLKQPNLGYTKPSRIQHITQDKIYRA